MNTTRQPLIVGLNASPRVGGNCDILLTLLLQQAVRHGCRAEAVNVARLHLAPCLACAETRADGRCQFDGGFQSVFDHILAADAVVVASPIYFGSVSAQLKTTIDRFQCFWQARQQHPAARVKKPGALLLVQAGQKAAFFDNAGFIVRQFFATVDVATAYELRVTAADQSGSVRQQLHAVERAEQIGELLALDLHGAREQQ